MMNSNLKTQVQARINAITGATTLSELLQLQTQANGLGCDTTLLDAQIQSRNTAAGAGTSTNDMTVLALLAGGAKDQVYYQVPADVMADDLLYIDALGNVSVQSPVPAQSIATSASSYTGDSVTFLASNSFVSEHGFLFQLSDSNWLMARNVGSGLLDVFVLSTDFASVLSKTTVTMVLNGSYSTYYSRALGVREVSANVFRLYYAQAISGETDRRSLAYNTITYNTSTKAVTAAAGAEMAVLSSGQSFSPQSPLDQGARFVMLGRSSATLACLDMQNATLVSYTTDSNGGNSISGFDESSAGNEWALGYDGSGTPRLYKAGADTVKVLPSNLTADGCFGSGWLPRRIAPGMYITSNNATQQTKLVRFAANHDTCTIYVLDAKFAIPSTGQIFKVGDRFLVDGAAFTWTGLAAPTAYQRLVQRAPAESALPGISSRKKVGALLPTDYVCASMQASVLRTSVSYKTLILSTPASRYTQWAPTPFAKALAPVSAGGTAELKLLGNSRFTGLSTPANASGINHQGVITQLNQADILSKVRMCGQTSNNANSANTVLFASIYPTFIDAQSAGGAVSGSVVESFSQESIRLRGSFNVQDDSYGGGTFSALTPYAKLSAGIDWASGSTVTSYADMTLKGPVSFVSIANGQSLYITKDRS